jgi:endonuclease/exonuclease/phosphatase family metal-dependent hydrolase
MKRSLITFSLFAIAASLSVAAPTIKVGTYNIRVASADVNSTNAWKYRKGDLANLVRKLDLDIVAFQEVRPNQREFLQKAFPEYTVSGFFHNDAQKQNVGTPNPIFFRKERFDLLKEGIFWLSETPDVPNSKSWDSALPRLCSWVILTNKTSGTTLCFANVHTDHISKLAREKGMEVVLNRLDEIAPKGASVILVGDHNCRENAKPAQLAAAKM